MSEEAPATAVKEPKQGVGFIAREAITAGKSNEEALEAVKAAFPDCKTSLQTISWYRNNMRKTDPSVPSGRIAKKKAEPAAAEAGAKGEDPLA